MAAIAMSARELLRELPNLRDRAQALHSFGLFGTFAKATTTPACKLDKDSHVAPPGPGMVGGAANHMDGCPGCLVCVVEALGRFRTGYAVNGARENCPFWQSWRRKIS